VTLHFGMLGPLEVRSDAAPMEVRGARRRALLAYLLVHAGSPQPLDRIVDALAASDEAGASDGTVQTYVSQLRKLVSVDAAVTLTHRAGGYVLDVPAAALDASRFEELVAAASATTNPAQQLSLLDDALRLWRGAPLDEFNGLPWADDRARQLTRLYVLGQELRVGALLDLGQHPDAVSELERLVSTHPLHEPFWRQLAIARYRSGRQADALAAIGEARRALAQELGIEPGPELADVERMILTQDPALDTPVPRLAGTAPAWIPERDALPDGVVTFVLTDIEDSTRLWDIHPTEMAAALVQHEAIVDKTVHTNDGRVIKSRGEGDATLSAFPRASDALVAAAALQAALQETPWTGGLELRTRVAIHTGEAQLRDGDYYGGTLNRAARIRGLARGNETLVSRATHDLVADALPSGLALVEAGSHELKGLRRQETVFRLEHGAARALLGDDADAEPRVDEARVPFPTRLESSSALTFTGRVREIDALLRAWRSAANGHRRAVLLTGEPGIGKTRLASELAKVAHDDGALVLYGACEDGMHASFQPFGEALAWYCEHIVEATFGRYPGDLSRLSVEVERRIGPLPASDTGALDSEQLRLFEATTSWLVDVAQQQPIVFLVDDLHWATEPTLFMLRHLLRQSSSARILVVVTYRHTDIDRSHPLASMLGDLLRIDGVERLALDGLDETQMLELFGTAADGEDRDDAAAAFAKKLQDDAGGNPLFVREILRHFVERGELREHNGRWIVTGRIEELGLPAGVKDVLAQRLERLGPDACAALEGAAVAGQAFDIATAVVASGSDESLVIDAVSAAVKAQLVEDIGDDGYRFTHALVRGALDDEIGSSRRIRIHRRIAEHLETTGADAAATAYHWIAAGPAGDVARAIPASTAAGDAAMHQLAFAEAVEHFDRALRLFESSSSGRERQYCELLISAASARNAAGQYARARDACVECGEIAGANGFDDLVVAAGVNISGLKQLRRKIRPEELAVVAAAFDTCARDDPATRSQLASRHAGLLPEGSEERRRWADTALELARSSRDDSALRLALSERAWALFEPSAVTEQLRLAEEVTELAEQSGSLEAVFDACVLNLVTLGIGCRWTEHESLRDQLEYEAFRVGNSYFHALSMIASSSQQIAQGRLSDADAAFKRAWSVCSEPEIMQAASAPIFRIHQFGGRLEELVPVFERRRSDTDATFDVLWLLAYSLLLCDLGRDDEAQALFGDVSAALAVSIPQGARAQLVWLPWSAQLTAQLGELESAQRLHDLLTPWDGLHCYGSLAANEGPVALYLGMLERVLEIDDDAEHHLESAIAYCDDLTAESFGCLARAELIALLERRGLRAERKRVEQLRSEIQQRVDEQGLHGVLRHLELVRAHS
jgi:class 3 adenylate cyclase